MLSLHLLHTDGGLRLLVILTVIVARQEPPRPRFQASLGRFDPPRSHVFETERYEALGKVR